MSQLNSYMDSMSFSLPAPLRAREANGVDPEKVSVMTADGRTLVGTLFSADNQTNLVSLPMLI